MNIYEIAKLAQVSTSTVSKVINGRGEVGEETKQRVLSIMKEHDYKPRISANAATNIGVFTHAGNVFASAFLTELLTGICEYFFSRDFGVLILPTAKIPKERGNFRVFCHKERLAGGIFLDLVSDESYIEKIDGVIPLVAINAEFRGDRLYSVASDDYSGCRQAIEYLYNLGHTRIAFGTIGMNYRSHRLRLQAYKDVLRERGLPSENRLIFSTERDFGMVYEHWRMMDIMPTAIVTINDQEALKLMSYLKSIDVRIPHDVSLVGFDNYSFTENLSPPLTTVRQPLAEASRKASTIIYDCLTGRTPPNDLIILPEELVARRSVADLRAAAPACAGV